MSPENKQHSPSADQLLVDENYSFSELLNDGSEEWLNDFPIDEIDDVNNYFTESGESSDAIISQSHMEKNSPFNPQDLTSVYLHKIGQPPLLEKSEEQSLAKTIQAGEQAIERLVKLSQNNPDSINPKLKQSLLHSIDKGFEAKDELIIRNTKLVVSVAKQYIGKGLHIDDLIQEGNLGLIRAALKFEYERGWKFSTFATWWIRQGISRAVLDYGRTIRVPVHMGQQIININKARRELRQELDRNPTIEELADKVSLSPEQIDFIFKNSKRSISLHEPPNSKRRSLSELEIGQAIADPKSPNPEDIIEKSTRIDKLYDALDQTLTQKELKVIKLRFGLVSGKKVTLDKVGKMYGVSRENIRKIESTALRKLRSPKILKMLEGCT